MKNSSLFHRLFIDCRAVTTVEFAFISPILVLVIMGLGDVLYQEYVQAILNGALQKAGRDSSIQGSNASTVALAIDSKVIGMVGTVMKSPSNACPATASGTWCSTRVNYDNFTEVAPEPFTDTDNDGRCDHGEPYSDINGNGGWDADPGTSGQGGANDVTLYTMTITYPRIFPVAGIMGLPATQTITSNTLLKNQPYASQSITTVVTRNCS